MYRMRVTVWDFGIMVIVAIGGFRIKYTLK